MYVGVINHLPKGRGFVRGEGTMKAIRVSTRLNPDEWRAFCKAHKYVKGFCGDISHAETLRTLVRSGFEHNDVVRCANCVSCKSDRKNLEQFDLIPGEHVCLIWEASVPAHGFCHLGKKKASE